MNSTNDTLVASDLKPTVVHTLIIKKSPVTMNMGKKEWGEAKNIYESFP